jgi:hypothetical protein
VELPRVARRRKPASRRLPVIGAPISPVRPPPPPKSFTLAERTRPSRLQNSRTERWLSAQSRMAASQNSRASTRFDLLDSSMPQLLGFPCWTNPRYHG